MLFRSAAALALSFVPAAGEALTNGRTAIDDQFTYHHLRRNLYNLCRDTGIQVDSRYVVPSSHLTVGRFINPKDFSDSEGNQDPAKIKALVDKIEEINDWLKAEFWPNTDKEIIRDGGEWIVGGEKGLNCRMGTLWYGGGESVCLGKGF